jgi:hypothetical protein
MAENFFTGLTGAIQQNARQRNNDDYIELMRQKQLQREMSGALADKRAAAADLRADEDMVMKREAAIRTQKDFDFRMGEAERKRAEDASFKQGSADIYKRHFGQTPERDANGQEIKDEAGNVRMRTPSPTDPVVLGNYLSEFTGHLANSGRMDPGALKQLTEMRSTMEKDGTARALQQWMAGDVGPANALAQRFGYEPKSMRMVVEQDPNTKLYTPYLYATSKDGKQVKQELATFQMAMGLPVSDPSAGRNEREIAGARMRTDALRAQAAVDAANRPRGGGGGGGRGGDDGDDDSPLTGKALRKELTAFDGMLGRDKPEFTSSTVGSITGPDMKERKVDDFKTDRVRELGIRALESGNARSAPEALAVGKQRYEAIEKEVLSGVWFVPAGKKNDSMGWRVAISPERPAGAVPYNSDRVDPTLRIAGRNAAVTQRFKEISAREQKPQTAIKR